MYVVAVVPLWYVPLSQLLHVPFLVGLGNKTLSCSVASIQQPMFVIEKQHYYAKDDVLTFRICNSRCPFFRRKFSFSELLNM